MSKYTFIKDEKLVAVDDVKYAEKGGNVIVMQVYHRQPYKVGIVYGDIDAESDKLCIGWSVCSEHDEFDKKIGIECAIKRFKSEEKFNLPDITSCPDGYKIKVVKDIYEIAYQLIQTLMEDKKLTPVEALEIARVLPHPAFEPNKPSDNEVVLSMYNEHGYLLHRLSDYIGRNVNHD